MELLGSYNPHEKVLNVKKDRIEYWISKGAQVSPTVNNLLVNHKIWDKPKVQSWKPKAKPKAEVTATKTATSKAEVPKEEPAPVEAQPEPAIN